MKTITINPNTPFFLIKKFFRRKRIAVCSVSVPDMDIITPTTFSILYDMDSDKRSITVSEIKVFEGNEITDVRDSFAVVYYSSFCSKFISSFIEYFMCKGFEVYVSGWICEWFSLSYITTEHTRIALNDGTRQLYKPHQVNKLYSNI